MGTKTAKRKKTAPPKSIKIIWPAVRLSKVASRDETRWIINHVEAANGRLAVTDGRRLIVIPHTAIPEGFQCTVPIDLVRAIEESELRTVNLTHNQAAEVEAGDATLGEDAIQGSFPNVEKAIPDRDTYDTRISFNARLLYEIALAIGGSKNNTCVTLSFQRNTSNGIGIHVWDSDREHEAVLMPLTGHRGPELSKV